MARAIWTGTVSFGLVSIPVRLYNATSPKDVRFHQFDRQSGKRIRYRRVTEDAGEWETPGRFDGAPEQAEQEAADSPNIRVRDQGRAAGEPEPEASPGMPSVPYEDLVKGFEVDRDRFVMIEPDELEALRPEQSRTIEIEHFVDLQDIDPVYFEKSYYLAPSRGVGAEKPYGLLLAAMEQARKVGIATFVLRSKEYLAAIRPVRGVLGLETMFFDDEVRTAEEIDLAPANATPTPRELEVAVRLIELLATDWDPSRYRDTYRERVLELIEGKLEREAVVVPEERPRAAPGIPDLMAALKASVEAARRSAATGHPSAERTASKRPPTEPARTERAKGRGRRTG